MIQVASLCKYLQIQKTLHQPRNESADGKRGEESDEFLVGEVFDEMGISNGPEAIEKVNVHEREGNGEGGTVDGGHPLQLFIQIHQM